MKNINSILIINRGEIACRVIKTCKKLGIRSIAIYSDVDADSLFVKLADEAYALEGNQPLETYLNQDKIIKIIEKSGAEAVHPGYGFLSENADFAQKCMDLGIVWIGPNTEAIRVMGSKSASKLLMEENNLPVVPGYNGEDQSIETIKSEAQKIGFPLLLKASAGGGGKGMRIVRHIDEIENAISSAQREALSAFGDQRLIIEKYIENARHIEFQIFGDKHGKVIHLLERECSIQRRYQKVLEESPSPVLSSTARDLMGKTAVEIAKTLNYDNAGTVEFIYDEKDESFFFLEVNTRLQVEHPVTELITGLDLVELQIASAEGKPLYVNPEDVKANGYAVELRLYAEDPANDFVPATGKIHFWDMPKIDGLRVDTGVGSTAEISTYYDPMIAKIIMHGQNRQEAQRKMLYALKNTICLGLTTNQDFLIQLLENELVQKGQYSTKFLETSFKFQNKTLKTQHIADALIVSSMYKWLNRNQNADALTGWRNNFYEPQFDVFQIGEEAIKVLYKNKEKDFTFYVNDESYKVELLSQNQNHLVVVINGKRTTFAVAHSGNEYFVNQPALGNVKLTYLERFPEKVAEKDKGGYIAPMPAEVISVNVSPGQEVKEGEVLLILTSMKMEIAIEATADGKVDEVFVEAGQSIEAGTQLLKVLG